MSRYSVHVVSGVAFHYPQRLALVCADPQVGELCRTQTAEKASRLHRALDLLERFERGELIERPGPASD